MYNDTADNSRPDPTRLRIKSWPWILAAAWSIAVAASAAWNLLHAKRQLLEQARNELRTNFHKDLNLRQWAAAHGGVYVPVTDETRPDPYTEFLPERDVVTPSGRLLTLLNPATVLRQYYELSARSDGARGHISSLRPLNPANVADPWEVKALQAFETGREEVSEVVGMDGGSITSGTSRPR